MPDIHSLIKQKVAEHKVYLDMSKIIPGEYLLSIAVTKFEGDFLLAQFGGEIIQKKTDHTLEEWRVTGKQAAQFADFVFPCLNWTQQKIARNWSQA